MECFTEKLKRHNKLSKRGNRVAGKGHYENRDVFELIKFLEYLLQIFRDTKKIVTREEKYVRDRQQIIPDFRYKVSLILFRRKT